MLKIPPSEHNATLIHTEYFLYDLCIKQVYRASGYPLPPTPPQSNAPVRNISQKLYKILLQNIGKCNITITRIFSIQIYL